MIATTGGINTTQDPFEGNQNRWDWNKPLPQDDRFDYLIKEKNDNSGIYFAVFFYVLIFLLIPCFCSFLKYFCEMSRRNYYDRLTASDPRRSTPAQQGLIHTISRNITPERRHYILEFSRNTNYDRLAASDPRRSPSSQRSAVSTISSNITHERRHFILEFSNPVSDSNNIVLPADQRPRYDEGATGDLIAGGNFQVVHPSIPDTPPLKYDDNIPPRN